MNNITAATTTTTTHSALPTTATMSPPGTTTRPTPPSQVGPTSSASKSWYSAPSAPAPTMIGPSRPKRMPAGRHVMIGGPSSPTSTLSQATPTGHHGPEPSQQRLNNQHMSTRPMNQSMNAMPSSAQATTGSSYGNPSGPARAEKVDMPRA
ncbi:hypothetical protein JMJ35_006256 [Cladonia borealis]|uniref:Uncharacterized protein n=1 Tax=Cladonia borealis TaxID=184061 RepID=A0AA39QYU5_9LECA|nr:hypothetical protein JMJ35_006256 [Cladonia borealis]